MYFKEINRKIAFSIWLDIYTFDAPYFGGRSIFPCVKIFLQTPEQLFAFLVTPVCFIDLCRSHLLCIFLLYCINVDLIDYGALGQILLGVP